MITDKAKQLKEYQELRKRSVELRVAEERRVLRYMQLLRFEWNAEIYLLWKGYLDDVEYNKLSNNVVFESRSQEELSGNMGEIGITPEGISFCLDDVRLRMFVAIFGETRAGKTTLLYKIITQLADIGKKILILDIKGDYSGLARLIKKTVVLRARETCINTLLPPLNTPAQLYYSCYVENFSQMMSLMSGSAFYLNEQINKLHAKNNELTHIELEQYLKDNPPRGNIEKQYYARTLNRIKEINITLNNLNVRTGYPIEIMMDDDDIDILVIDLKGLPSILKRYLGSTLLLRRFLYLLNSSVRNNPVSNVIVVDESKEIFAKKNEQDLKDAQGLPVLTRLASQIGEFNTALIVAEQIPRMLSDGIKANCGTVICFRLGSGEDIFEVSRTMNLTKEQMAVIPDLKPGEAIVRTI